LSYPVFSQIRDELLQIIAGFDGNGAKSKKSFDIGT
jgi:hypothetical protein